MEIFRTESADEKKDFKAIRINKEDVFDKFRKKISDKEREYSKQRKPYCARCAKLDFKNSNEERARQMEIKIGYIDFENSVYFSNRTRDHLFKIFGSGLGLSVKILDII